MNTVIVSFGAPPTISDIGNQTINEDGNTGSLGFTVSDADTAAGSLTVTALSSNTTLVPNANLSLGGSGTSRNITVTPVANLSGTSTITVTVSDGTNSANDTFVVTVNAINDTPTISNISNQTINEDANTGALGFTIGDVETAAGSLTVTATSSNITLVPNANLTLGGSGASRTITVTPAANQNGTATITVTVSDGVNSANDTFTLTVNAVNDTPTISNINNQTISEDTSTAALSFTVGDVETAAGSLTVTASSSNTTLVPNANLTLGGSGASRTITATPATDQYGTSTITVTISDGSLSANDTFVLTVTNQPDLHLPATSTTGTFTVSFGGWSSTYSLLEENVGGTWQTLSGASGSDMGSVELTRANGTYTFRLQGCTVTPNPPAQPTTGCNTVLTKSIVVAAPVPTISDISNQTINEDTNTGSLGFTIGGAGSLTVTASSSNTTLVPNASLTLGGSGTSRNITVTPVANLSGTSTITVTVTDGTNSANDTFTVTVNAVNDSPTISDIGNQTINEDGTTGSIDFTIGDVETATGSLTITTSSSNITLVPNSNLSVSGVGSFRMITVTPAANQFGTSTITVTVSDGTTPVSDTFVVTVNAVNDLPTISNITDKTIDEDTNTGIINFTVGDVETAAGSLTISASSNNHPLIPSIGSNLTLGGSGATRTIMVTPVANKDGWASITVTVSDGTNSVSDIFKVTVNEVNDLPTITNISDQTINEDGNTGALSFTLGDIETAVNSLTVTASSSNTTLVPYDSAHLTFGGSGANRTLTVTPAANQSGTATITMIVGDGSGPTYETFTVTVNAINDAPTISNFADRTVNEDINTGALAFTIGDVETAASSLTVTAWSSNSAVVPNHSSYLALGGSGSSRTLTVTPTINKSGTATITVTVSDGTLSASDTFTVTVNSTNDAPVISNIADQTINQDGNTGGLGFTVSDVETAASALTVTASSSNTVLVPNGNLILVGAGGSRSIMVTPAANQFGTVTITVTVSDGTLSTSDTFTVAVNNVPRPPSDTDGDGIFTVSWNFNPQPNGGGYVNLAQRYNGGDWMTIYGAGLGSQSRTVNVVAEFGTGSGTYEYKLDYGYVPECGGPGGCGMTYGSTSLATVLVLLTSGVPSIGSASADGCAGSLSVDWSPGTEYPAGSTIYYDLQESINGAAWAPKLFDTTLDSWSGNAAASDSYQYRVRSRYFLDGYYSGYTGWVSNSSFVMPGCGGGGGGEIIPDPIEQASDPIGAIEGSLTVLPSGAASYSIPLEVPPGIGGMAPKLSLNYNSQSGNGFIGVGFSLGGLSAITHCPAVKDVDGYNGGVNFQSNRFCLDDRRLIQDISAVLAEPGAVMTYRTEIDDFTKIVAIGNNGVGLPVSFTVRTPTGEKMTYGARNDSRIEPQGQTYRVMAWALDSITDSAGNKMEFYYDEDNTKSEYVPSRIEYAFANSVSGAKVEFGYGTQSSPTLYIAGSQVRTTKLLQTVTTYVDGQAVKEYDLNYETAPGSGRKRLKELAECSLVSGTVCLEPTVFTWQGSKNDPIETSMGSRPSGHHAAYYGFHWPIDVDGNGEQELVYALLNTYEFWYVGSTIESGSGRSEWGQKDHLVGEAKNYWVMDVNGDGLSDLVYRDKNYPKGYWVLKNKGNGDAELELWADAAIAGEGGWPIDINSDGRMDLVYVTAGGFTYRALISQNEGILALDDQLGSRPNHGVGLDGTHWVMDINSDARPDLVYIEAGSGTYHAMINGGLAFSWHDTWATRSYPTPSAYGYANWPIDVNGDGLIDLVYCNDNSPSNREYRVLINKGDLTVEDQEWITRPHDNVEHGGQHWVLDTNADGIMDLVYKPNGTDVWSLESRANGGRQAVNWGDLSSDDGGDDPDHLIELDSSGDGLLDLVNASNDVDTYHVLRNNSKPDLLLSVRDGHDNVSTAQYKLLTDNSVYDRGENPYEQYPNVTVETPMHVVSKLTVPDGIGGTRNTEYFYKKLKINQNGRGTLGFAQVVSTDVEAGIRVETNYEQLFPRTGFVSSSVRCLDNGNPCQESNVLQRTSNTYVDQITVDGPGINGYSSANALFVYQSQTIETMYALNNYFNTTSKLATITTTNSIPDAYGNIQSIKVKTQSEVNSQYYETETINTYTNRTTGTTWRLGLLTSSSVTKYLDGGATDLNSTRTTAFVYDTAKHLLSKETVEPGKGEPLELVTAYERDSYGNITKATVCATDFSHCGQAGYTGTSTLPFRITTTAYDANGQFPQSITNAEGEGETYVYERKFGNKLSLTGPNGLTTSWLYDGFGKPLKETRADDSLTFTTYKWCDGDCPQRGLYYVMKQSTGGAPVTEYFDAQGRKLRTRTAGFNGRNIHVDTVFNNLGQAVQVSEPYFENDPAYWTHSQYDRIGRIVTLTPPLSPAVQTDYEGLITTMSRIVNGVLRTESETKNIIGQTERVTNPAGTELRYGYDSQGNLKTTWTEGHSNTLITVTSDLLGRKTQVIDPDMGTWNYQYNAYGDLVSQTNAKNETVTMKYDRISRMTERNEIEGQTVWTYGTSASAHNIGKLASISAPGGQGSQEFEYDDLGRPSQTKTFINIAPYSTPSNYLTGQTYDAAGRASTVLYPEVNGSRFQVKNHYNPLGYLSKVTSLNGSVVYWEAQEMNARGQLEIAQLGNGASVLNSYMPETGWLDGTMVDASDLIYHMTYEIDEVGNIATRTDERQGLTEEFHYDILDQLTYSNVTSGTASYIAKNYQYDALGNITSKTNITGVAETYTYGTCNAGPHAVCQVGGSTTYAYNANGSMVNKNGGTAEVQYTSFNMPYQFDDLGSDSVTFHYGPDRNRIFKSGANGTTAYIGMTGTGNPLYEHEVQEVGVMEKHLHFIYAGGQAVAAHTIQTGSSPQTKTEYLHRDHLGSVEAVSNSSGAAVAYFSHDAWGKPRNADWTDSSTTNAAPGNLGFTGHEMIPEVGFIHMNGRVYDPVLGKFLSADPHVQFEKDVRSYNRYAYVSNNPLRYTDPTGYLRTRIEKWFKKHFGTILNVVSIFYPPLRPFAAAYGMLNAAYYGAGIGQIAASAFAGYIGGEVGRYVAGVSQTATSMLFHQAVISGAVSGGITGGVGAMLTDSKVSRGILQGMATGAATAAIVWKASQSPAQSVRSEARFPWQERELPNSPLSREQQLAAKRALWVADAENRVDDTDYAYAPAHSPLGANQYKCNLFVYDRLVGVVGLYGHAPKTTDGLWPLQAGNWANPNQNIPGWVIVSTPQAGDIVASAYTSYNAQGDIVATGHVGIVVDPVNEWTVSARTNAIVRDNFGFGTGNFVYRRYVGY